MKNLRPLFALSLFLGSALLFLIEPIVAKLLLPPFGGSPLVWNVCLLFFQVALLLGYLYAHRISRRGSPRWIHVVAMLAAGILFAATFLPWTTPGSWFRVGLPPALGLTLLLAIRIGAPFVLLSATAPLLQAWYGSARDSHSEDPYFLYAASNLGSLAGLLSYPLAIEPNLTLGQQRAVCVAAFGAIVALLFACARAIAIRNVGDQAEAVEDKPAVAAPLPWPQRARWALLAAGPSAMLMGLTGYLTINIAPVPLLWVVPLALYLLTFVIAFARRKFLGGRTLWTIVPALCFPAVVTLCMNTTLPIEALIPIHLFSFFVIALASHTQLNELRPSKAHLTEYYVWISIGGGVGGVFAAVFAPAVFHSLMEYPIAIVAACIALGTQNWRWRKLAIDFAVGIVAVIAIYWVRRNVVGPSQHDDWTFVAFGLAVLCSFRPIRYGLVLAATIGASNYIAELGNSDVMLQVRNFFGVHTVLNEEGGKLHLLTNGTTRHGAQWTDPPRDLLPLTYYGLQSPIGQVFSTFSGSKRKDRVAVVGLGTGTLASYGVAGQKFDFYDIDPMVVRIAEDPRYFTYLANCKADWRVILGDARLSLNNADPGRYGLIALDAFASDAIPVHLITVEALSMYASKLTPDGILAVHISNRYLDLRSVIAGAAKLAGLVSIVRSDPVSAEVADEQQLSSSLWMLLARRPADFGGIADDPRWETVVPKGRPWTDDYSDVVEAVKWSPSIAKVLKGLRR